MEKRMERLVEEFLRRDSVSPATKRRVERLRSNGDAAGALEAVLEDRERHRSEESAPRESAAD